MSDLLHLNDRSNEQSLFVRRALTVMAIVMVLVAVLIARMIQLQVFEHERYTAIADENRVQLLPIPPARGLIVDRNGKILAHNEVVHSLTIVREQVDDLEETLKTLTTLVRLNEDEIKAFRRRLKIGRRPYEGVALRTQASEEDIAKIVVREHALPGVHIEAKTLRHYPEGALVAHAVGSVRRINEQDLESLDAVKYAGTDYIGKLGLERHYESVLHGHVGHELVEIDARGHIRRKLERVAARSGQNLRLHLDLDLQRAADAALGDRRGSIVAIEPATGGILAMVSKPGYDPNPFVRGISQTDYRALIESPDRPMFNRVTQGSYPPGSTFKPFVGLAALSQGVTTWQRTIYDRGSFRLRGSRRVYRDWNWTSRGGGHGVVNLSTAIYRSCNIYFYTMAYELGVNRLSPFVEQFGFGHSLAVDVGEGSIGVLPTEAWKKRALKQPWYPGDSVSYGIGQGFLTVTPMQLAAATNVLANRGRIVAPRLMMSADGDANELEAWPPDGRVEGVSASDWDNMVAAMEDVVHRGRNGAGTAFSHIGKDLQYRMAGKSGTAQVVEIAQGRTYNERSLSERNRKHAWFIAFAPADAPRIAVTVLVENGGGGSAVAAPVARAVIDAWLLRDQLVAQR